MCAQILQVALSPKLNRKEGMCRLGKRERGQSQREPGSREGERERCSGRRQYQIVERERERERLWAGRGSTAPGDLTLLPRDLRHLLHLKFSLLVECTRPSLFGVCGVSGIRGVCGVCMEDSKRGFSWKF